MKHVISSVLDLCTRVRCLPQLTSTGSEFLDPTGTFYRTTNLNYYGATEPISNRVTSFYTVTRFFANNLALYVIMY